MSQDPLRDNLGYQLHLAARRVDAHDRALLAEFGLTPARYTALLHLRDHPGIDQTELGRLLLVNRSAGMKVASKLGELGLAVRSEGRDKRSVGLFLTPGGHEVLSEAEDRLLAAPTLADSPFAGLSAPRRKQLLELLRQINTVTTESPDGTEPAANVGEQE